jgi:hypothetical protein
MPPKRSFNPPPPPTRSRSFEELRKQVEDLKIRNEELAKKQDLKEEPTPSSIAKKNPNRSQPNPNQPAIKLFNYATDWIEQDRSNVVVELNQDFEDETIKRHSTIVENDNLSLLGKNDQQIQAVVKGYESFSILNLVYRLLITLPSSYRLEAKSLIDALQADEVPKNTPVLCEMYSHIGKTKTANHGNLRLKYPLQLAKKKIIKAMSRVHNIEPFASDFQYKDNATWNDISTAWHEGFFLDKDAPEFIASKGLTYLNSLDEKVWSYKHRDDNNLYFMLPEKYESKYHDQGRYKPTAKFVNRWIKSIRLLSYIDEESYYKSGSAMICQMIDFNYIKKGDLKLSQWNSDFNDSAFKNLTWNDMSTYLGIVKLDNYMSVDQLAINYFIMVDHYRNICEKHVANVFKLVNVKKDEFGSEAQMMVVDDWNIDKHSAVDTTFKFEDKNKAVAAGVFNFTKSVDYHVSDRMYMKNTFRSVISNLISSFSRK